MCGCNRAKQAVQNNIRSGVPAPRAAPVAPAVPSIDTSVWGPSTWIALHIASVFSSQNLPLWKELLAALQYDIPCPDCRAHYSRWFQAHPFRANSMLPIRRMMGQRSSPPKIIPWLLNLHNDINSRTGVPVWNESQIHSRYGGDRTTRLSEGRASLETVRGILGKTSFSLLSRLLA